MMIVSLVVLLATSALCEDQPVAEQTPAAEPAKPVASADDETEKHQRALLGLMALCGILIGGLGFLAVVMIWGARLRRMVRRELPPQKTLQNELWFLKPPKASESERDREIER
jgi:hypothetical protein